MSSLSNFQLESKFCNIKVHQDIELYYIQQNVTSWRETNKKKLVP